MARVSGTNQEDNGAFREVVDEFTFPGNQQVLLQESQAWVQALFPVVLTVLGSLQKIFHYDLKEGREVPERIWLQLKGSQEAVHKAKEFIKGLSDPEMSATEKYPKEMHCIFVGARRCFLQSLIRDTCANVKVLEIGVLAVSGATEPVVMAQSKVQQFVKVFRDNVSLTLGKEPEVKRKFKDFVETHADKYTVDLLFLPSTLKEELLMLITNDRYLVAQDDLDIEIIAANSRADNQLPCSQDEVRIKTPVSELTCQMDSVFPSAPKVDPSCSSGQQERLKAKRRGSEKENECRKKQFSIEDIQADGPGTNDNSKIPIIDLIATDSEDSDIIILDQEPVSVETEYKILVNFFKTMGYPQSVVEKVISDLGQSEEPLKLLDEIEKRSPSQHVENFTTKDECWRVPASKPTQEVNVAPAGTSNQRFLPNPNQELEAEKNVSFVARGTSSPPSNKRIAAFGAPGTSQQPNARITRELLVKSNSAASSGALLNNRQATKHEPSVTGVQIFLNAIKTPFKLELKNEPGREDLRHIVIDGSNVAMSHGMKRFFSCRGIAIAVEYFWKSGHRKITVFVPQWRTKRDPNITEQHFLTELEELGILSFTPARTVMGSRIASHDDRFLLHLAEKTRGIIVTNDNLREFVDESPAWQQIIKDRILQYTFAGDIFMLPDDPLGRHGPKLNDFLIAKPEHRNTSFPNSGVLSSSHPLTRPILRLDAPPPNLFAPMPINPAIVNMPRPRAANFLPGPINPAILNMPHPQAANVLLPGLINPPIANMPRPRAPLPTQRNNYETSLLRKELSKIFPETEQREKIGQVLSAHPYMRDLNALSAMILD